MSYHIKQDTQGKKYIEPTFSGYELISSPLLNKGMSFSEEERKIFNLLGLLPCHYAMLEEQEQRSNV